MAMVPQRLPLSSTCSSPPKPPHHHPSEAGEGGTVQIHLFLNRFCSGGGERQEVVFLLFHSFPTFLVSLGLFTHPLWLLVEEKQFG